MHEIQVSTVGGVVPPGAVIINVIPTGLGLDFEVRIEPSSIDQVAAGQKAKLMLSAFNQRTTPELQGKVRNISPDIVVDEQTGASFYRAWLTVKPDELARLNGLVIVPGMPLEAFIQTDKRTILSYVLKPLTDHLRRAFREE